MSSWTSQSVLLLSSLLFLTNHVTGKPSVYVPPPMYPYTLSYRLGEFQGAVFYGAPEGTAVAVKGTLGHEKYHPLYIGVDVKKTEERQALNPFLNRNSIHSDDHLDKNKTQTVTQGMQMVVSGTTAFTVNGAGDILVQPSSEKYELRATIYFCVVLVQTDNGAILSNPLSFVVEIVENTNGDLKNKNAITAGVLVLLILFIAAVTGIVIKCRNCASDKNTEGNKSTSSVSEEDEMDSKDHYHIKAEDAIIMGKVNGNQSEGPARDGVKGRPRLVRSDSTLSWLKLHLHDEDDRDSGMSSLPTISENFEDRKIDINMDFSDIKCNCYHNGNISTPIDPSKSILKKSRRNSRHSHVKRKKSKESTSSDERHDSIVDFVEG